MEQIYLSGIDPKIPQWARESTLKEVNKNLLEMVKLLGGTSGSKKVGTDPKALAEYNKQLKQTNTLQKKNQKHIKEFTDTLDDNAKSTDAAMLKLRQSLFEGESSFSKTSKSTSIFSKVVGFATGPLGLLTSGVGLANAALYGLKEYVEQTITAFLGIYDTGIVFQKGLFDFRLAATEAALPLNEFAKLLTENSAVVASFGLQGGRALGNLSLQTRRLVYEQMKLGVSFQDINDYLGSYLETQRMQGLLNQIDRAKQSQYAANYIKELTLYSQVLGKSRKQIDEETKRAARRPDVFAKLSSLGGELGAQAAQTFTQVSAAFSGVFGEASSEFNDAFASLVVSLNPYETDLVKTLIASGNQDIANQLIEFANAIKTGSLSQEEVNSSVADIVGSLKNSNVAAISNLIETRSQFAQGATSLSGILQNIASIDDLSLARLRAGQAIPVDPFTASIQRIGQLFQESRAKFENIFVTFIQANMGTFEKIATNIAVYAQEFSKKMEGFLSLVSQLFDEKSRAEALAKIKDSITTGIDWMITYILDTIGDYINSKINPFYESPKETKKKADYAAEMQKNYEGQFLGGLVPPIYTDKAFAAAVPAPKFKETPAVGTLVKAQSFGIANQSDKVYEALMMQNQQLQTLININSDTKDQMSMMVDKTIKSNKSLIDVNRNIRNNSNTIR